MVEARQENMANETETLLAFSATAASDSAPADDDVKLGLS